MTLKSFIEKVQIGLCFNGTFRVDIIYRGLDYYCPSNNTLAYEAARHYLRGTYDRRGHHYTPKEAFTALWRECKRYNGLK